MSLSSTSGLLLPLAGFFSTCLLQITGSVKAYEGIGDKVYKPMEWWAASKSSHEMQMDRRLSKGSSVSKSPIRGK